ncbi:37S ribosomal protein [Geosmithia morbida]|uniref:37S ribosomal protein n=1 Tax=Geosmithia morbida TaxID=1094350 RepID=A0A9P4YUI5_9HYPO|nr:37S ribosomal protein [Geosmithia morbida]KAF4122034.1 37S ribosomal protein [Geosmithia morbida]
MAPGQAFNLAEVPGSLLPRDKAQWAELSENGMWGIPTVFAIIIILFSVIFGFAGLLFITGLWVDKLSPWLEDRRRRRSEAPQQQENEPKPQPTRQHKPMRLPPLQNLRVHNPKRKVENPCLAVMSSVLACWASAGYNATGCLAVENQLRHCMDGPKAPKPPSNTINYHLGRLQKSVTDTRPGGGR